MIAPAPVVTAPAITAPITAPVVRPAARQDDRRSRGNDEIRRSTERTGDGRYGGARNDRGDRPDRPDRGNRDNNRGDRPNPRNGN